MRRSASTKNVSAGSIERAVKARMRAVSALCCDEKIAVPERERELVRVAEH